MSESETLSDGRKVERGEGGKFTKTSLPPEVASAMGKRAAEKRYSNDDALEEMLGEAGYSADNPPPRYVQEVARMALKYPQAMRDWRKMTGQAGESASALSKGEACPTCGRLVNTDPAGLALGLDAARKILAILDYQARGNNPDGSITLESGGVLDPDRGIVYRRDQGDQGDQGDPE